MPRRLLVLGSTGSIGTQALDVISRAEGELELVGLSAERSWEPLVAQAREHGVARIALADEDAAAQAAEAWTEGEVLGGAEGLVRLVLESGADLVLNALVGSAGLGPTVATLGEGIDLALANKESLVAGGPLVQAAIQRPDQLVPVDSEHSALAQCLRGGRADEVRRLVLTASGGPFRGRTRAELGGVTPEQASAHPTWDMGPVITINSATLVHKGLELIEAHLLFGTSYDAIDVVVHPQSIVHSMVEFVDGSTLAQASPPDMRLPIALALGWPDRVPGAVPGLDWTTAQTWEFAPLDEQAFPAVALCKAAGRRGGTAPAVLNAANEVCVHAFVDGHLPFLAIVDTVAEVVETHEFRERPTLAEVLESERHARTRAAGLVESSTKGQDA